ncbi:hypothetical protein [Stenotrophomonas sp.]|uniref:hypothetical protein n=1 Tax=Stenotrophomonas sp. TaxID=69392 RepID=UPI0028AEAECF|nr:hypothetical protein [Stenotrophomonas sp.]
MHAFFRVSGIAVMLASLAALAGCASSGKTAAKAEELPVIVTVPAAPTAEKDALGNYRFLMQDGENKMSADQFDAWMKANGIRVAKGAPTAAASAEPAKN